MFHVKHSFFKPEIMADVEQKIRDNFNKAFEQSLLDDDGKDKTEEEED